MAEYFDITLGDLLEGIVLHALEAKAPPFGDQQLQVIADLKRVYGLDLDASRSSAFATWPSSRVSEA